MMICWKVFGKSSILRGWWFGKVRSRWSSFFLKHPFCPVSVLYSFFSSNHPGAKSVVRHGIEGVTFQSSDDLCLLFCLFLLLWQIPREGDKLLKSKCVAQLSTKIYIYGKPTFHSKLVPVPDISFFAVNKNPFFISLFPHHSILLPAFYILNIQGWWWVG